MGKFHVCLLAFTVIIAQAYGQTTWHKHSNNPVYPRGSAGTWDSQLMANPYIWHDSNIYHMWYAGYDGGNDGTSIGYAHSLNGIDNWTRHPNPVLDPGPSGSWDEITVYQPCVLFDGTTYHMWFGGHNGTTRKIGYATSTDSINWIKYPGNPILEPGPSGSWDDEFVDSPDILLIDGIYHMWYSGFDGTNTQIGHATSIDGITWEKDNLNPVLKVGSTGSWDEVMSYQPSVLFDDTTYHMWYSGGSAFLWSMGYAYSSDGIHWTKDALNPVLEPGLSGSWDDTFVGLGGVIFDKIDSTQFKMWYSGGAAFLVSDIGYATTTMPTGLEDDVSAELIRAFSLSQNYPNPFNPTTTISYQLPIAASVKLVVFNTLGQHVKTLVSASQPAGSYTLHWDGQNELGQQAASGVYLCRLTTESYTQTRKMLLMK